MYGKKIKKVGIWCVLGSLLLSLFGCTMTKTKGQDYSIMQIDLSQGSNVYREKFDPLYSQYLIDDGSNYMAHPDMVLLKDGRLMTMYPEGHGKGAVLTKTSVDGGKTWSERLSNTPQSWKESKETPTVYRLNFNDGSEKIVMISAVPRWWIPAENRTTDGDGFNASFSNDDGKNWTEFQNYYGKNSEMYLSPIVAMSSLTKLKDKDGNWTDSWLGTFHDHRFINYKTILTFEKGEMKWSIPVPYMLEYRDIEKYSAMCEVEIVRSDSGKGDELCLLSRSNGKGGGKKDNNSMVSFSKDEGETWTKPKEVPSAYSGERHKAEWLNDGRLFITFRSIERDKEKVKKYNTNKNSNWYSEGWIGWVGTYEDLVEGKEGQYRVKLAHTYLEGQTEAQVSANADTGYCGNVVLADGTIVTSSYGTFDKDSTFTEIKGKRSIKTSIINKRIDIALLDELHDVIKYGEERKN